MDHLRIRRGGRARPRVALPGGQGFSGEILEQVSALGGPDGEVRTALRRRWPHRPAARPEAASGPGRGSPLGHHTTFDDRQIPALAAPGRRRKSLFGGDSPRRAR